MSTGTRALHTLVLLALTACLAIPTCSCVPSRQPPTEEALVPPLLGQYKELLLRRYTIEAEASTIAEIGELIARRAHMAMVITPRPGVEPLPDPHRMHVSVHFVDETLAGILSSFSALLGLEWTIVEYEGAPYIQVY